MKSIFVNYVVPFVLGVATTSALVAVINLASEFKGW